MDDVSDFVVVFCRWHELVARSMNEVNDFHQFFDLGKQAELSGGFKYILFSPLVYLGKISQLTNIFHMGWFNHQLDNHSCPFKYKAIDR